MQFEFIKDLDDYFCEAYANYDKICMLPGYEMPKMHQTQVDAFGDVVAYTLPTNTMRLSLQENKAALLAALKEKMVDGDLSFSFSPVPWNKRIKNLFSKKAYHKLFAAVLKRCNISVDEAGKDLQISPQIWKKIVKGAYLPTKNLILSLALTSNMDYVSVKELLTGIGEGFDYTKVRDTVIAYLLFKKIANPTMQQAALDEYRVSNLFIKRAEE
ncbi:MAG: helix-turn-helix transcriptional regulator [Clostridia bacterium]|nr:helix-turn-helix transcriptional regulator [Clostridia bacterium]